MSNEDIKNSRTRGAPEGKVDKNGKPLKFSRNLEPDWTNKNDEYLCGLKEHVSVDVNNGFILAITISSASVNDSNHLPYCAAAS